VYLVLELTPGRFDWHRRGVQIAVDTYLPRVGQHRLPNSTIASDIGFEFLIELPSPDSGWVRVTPDYQRHDSRIDPSTGDDFGRFSRRPVVTGDRTDHRFDSLFVITNRARFGRTGTFYPAQGYDRGRLRYGTELSSSLADWYLDERAGLLELRIPWDLLNVTDPSTGTLLFDKNTKGDFGTAPAESFHFGAMIYQKEGRGLPADALPAVHAGVWRASDFADWAWEHWTRPTSYARLKPVYDSLKALWGETPFPKQGRPARQAPSN
jgi:hypothetical protein